MMAGGSDEEAAVISDAIDAATGKVSSSVLGQKYLSIKPVEKQQEPEQPEEGQTESAATSAQTSSGQTARKTAEDEAPCEHVYEWEVYKKATATTDGIMRYRCKYCGDVDYEVPVTAYYTFNKETQESIKNAAQGATVKITTPIFISFHEMVKDALIDRPDVTLVVDYRYQGQSYEMTIPAGSGDTLETLYGEDHFAGFRYLAGTFTTVEQ